MSPDGTRTDDLFHALSDPTRRAILDLLAQREVMTVTELAAQFPSLVRSGISKHLMALRQADLVYATRQGREQHYRVNPRAMRELLRPWVEKYEKYWDDRLGRLRDVAEARESAGGALQSGSPGHGAAGGGPDDK
ncbi:MAG: ArsR/SmtB family transcription factor [Bacillota bacterium]